MGPFLINGAAGLLLAVSAAATATPLAPHQMQADLQLVRRALEETHGGIYRYTSKAALARAFDGAAAKMNQPMDAVQFHRILGPVVAAIRCGHTAVILAQELNTAMEQALLLPLDVKLIDQRVYVLRDFDGSASLSGREIASINGVAISTIVERMMTVTHGDGFIATGRARRVARKFKEELFLQFGMQRTFTLALRGARPHTVTISGQALPALRLASASRYPHDQRGKGFAELSLLDNGNIAHLRIFRFSDEDEDDVGAVTLRKAFARINASGAHTLLLDVRDNGGG